jgi:hypothetical protein
VRVWGVTGGERAMKGEEEMRGKGVDGETKEETGE